MILRSNCKINIGLNIVKKRSDGFHDIQTIMYPLKSLNDIVEVVKNSSNEINYSESGIIVDCPIESNLCVKAAKLMQSKYKIEGVDIHLHKEVPFGAGLGGGSANATAVITALNLIFELGLSVEIMKNIAATLGSDTAFFVENSPQLAQGRGEILSPIEINLTGKYIIVIKPNVSISTKQAYSSTTPRTPKYLLEKLITQDISKWRDTIVNDFEQNLSLQHPELAQIKSDLYQKGAIYASMSGSGSSIYGVFNEKPDIKYENKHYFIHCAQVVE